LTILGRESQNPARSISRMWHEAIKLDFGVNHLFYHDLNYYYPELQDAVMKKVFGKRPVFLGKLIEEGIRKGYFHADILPGVVMEAMEILYTSITRTGRFKSFRQSPEIIMQNTIDPFIRGLCTAKGLKELDSFDKRILK
jgi:hypothetical protein